MTVYERIEKLRKQHKISQGNLEKELGFSNGSISKWRQSTPTFERLQKLADYFGVSVDYLMNGAGDNDSSLNEFPPEIRAAARGMMNLPPEDQKTAINLINYLSQKGREAKKE